MKKVFRRPFANILCVSLKFKIRALMYRNIRNEVYKQIAKGKFNIHLKKLRKRKSLLQYYEGISA